MAKVKLDALVENWMQCENHPDSVTCTLYVILKVVLGGFFRICIIILYG